MDNWLKWAVELQALSQAGLAYTENKYDRERFERIREIAAEMLVKPSGMPLEAVKDLFCAGRKYPTPQLDCRAAVFRDGRILLVREISDGRWSLPGGWVDVDQTVGSNLVKEVREEAGMTVEVERLIAVEDYRRRNKPQSAFALCKVFALCRLIGGEFRENLETDGCGFFALDDLPPLSVLRNNEEQIRMCFQAAEDENWRPILD